MSNPVHSFLLTTQTWTQAKTTTTKQKTKKKQKNNNNNKTNKNKKKHTHTHTQRYNKHHDNHVPLGGCDTALTDFGSWTSCEWTGLTGFSRPPTAGGSCRKGSSLWREGPAGPGLSRREFYEEMYNYRPLWEEMRLKTKQTTTTTKNNNNNNNNKNRTLHYNCKWSNWATFQIKT